MRASFDLTRARTRTVRACGYTLIELVTVIALLAIVAAFAAPRFFGNQVFSERGYTDELVAALRMAQKAAVASGCRVRVEIDAAGYRAFQQPVLAGHCDASSATWTTPVPTPDGQTLSGTTPADVTVSPDTVVTFDASGAATPGNQSLTVGTHTLSIEAATGFVTSS